MYKNILKLTIFFFLIFFSFHSVSAFTISRPSSVNQGLIGYWTFDGADIYNLTNQVTDRSGQGNTGTMTNMSTSTSRAPGKLGQALSFDNVNDYVNLPRINTDEMSVSAWFYKNANEFVNADAIWGNWRWNSDTQLQEGFDLRFYNYGAEYTKIKLDLVTTNGTTRTYKVSTFNLIPISSNGTSTKQWFHVVATYNKTDGYQRFYVDGVLRDSDLHVVGNTIVPFTYITGSCYNENATRIGYSCINAGYFNGKIDDVRLYNRPLSAAEVAQLYNQGTSKFNVSPTTKLTSGLVGYWTFDGPDINWPSDTFYDRSGYGNNASSTLAMTNANNSVIGKLGQSLKFNSSTYQKVYAADAASLDPVNITISAWVFPINISVIESLEIVDKGGNNGYRFRVNTNRTITFFDRGATNSLTTTTAVPLKKWSHVVATGDSSGLKIFINGVLSTSKSTAYGGPDTTNRFNIGGAIFGEYFDGYIDEVRVYNRALTDSEVKQLYNMGR